MIDADETGRGATPSSRLGPDETAGPAGSVDPGPSAPSERIPAERGVLIAVLLVVLVLDVGAVVTYFIAQATEHTAVSAITRDVFLGFEFTNEHNIPAWIASLLWAVFGLIGVVLALVSRRQRLGFAAIGAVGLFASLDEYAMIHERLAVVGERLVPEQVASTIGAWVLPGLVVAAVVALLLLRFVLSLPSRARAWLFIAAAVFLSGSLGAEAVWWWITEGRPEGVTPFALVLSGIEENLEMLGVGIAIAALVSLLDVTRSDDGVRIEIRREVIPPKPGSAAERRHRASAQRTSSREG